MQNPRELTTHYSVRSLPDQELKDYQKYPISTQLILNTATKMGMKIIPLPDSEVIELQYKKKSRFFSHQALTEKNSLLSHEITNNQTLVKHFLKQNNLPTPQGFILHQEDPQTLIEAVFRALPKPLVIKSLADTHGEEIYLNIKNVPNYKRIVSQLLKNHQQIVVEEMFEGQTYRLLSGHDQLFSVTQKIAAHVIGNHKNTILQLIEEKNIGREDHARAGHLVKISVNGETIELLESQNLVLNEVPSAEQKVQLKNVSSISIGGDSLDVTTLAHPSIEKIATETIQAIPGLNFGSLDLICTDITQPLANQKWAIIKVNDSPPFCMAEICAAGEGQKVSQKFLELLFT